MDYHRETMEFLKEGYSIIKSIKNKEYNRLDAFEHLQGRCDDYRKEIESDIRNRNMTEDKERLKDVLSFLGKINKKIDTLRKKKVEQIDTTETEYNIFADIMEDVKVIEALQQTRKQFLQKQNDNLFFDKNFF